jgi:cytochrome c oxidase subunit 3/cytochrome o ubiquinol oxidase subunit 3
MNTAYSISIEDRTESTWKQPSRGVVGMVCLIIAESAIFLIFVVAYIYNLGKSLSGPTPAQILELPVLGTICLLSSSLTVHLAVSALRKGNALRYVGSLFTTIVLGAIFLITTGREWYHLIHDEGLTLQTNLFGTTYYALVGLHAVHVLVGLLLLSIALAVSLAGLATEKHSERVEVLSLYWHFVDAIWVVVFLVVYVLGR